MIAEIKPQDDLTLEKSQESALEAEIEEQTEIEYTTRTDYITCAYSAISAVEDMDTGMMTKEDAKRIKRIMRKSLMIIDDCITEMYDELFEDTKEDDE
jgi:hypothetical protein